MSNALDVFETIFKKDKDRNAVVANIADLKRPDEPHMCLPGLRRYCEMQSKFRKIIIETSNDRLAAKMWLRSQGDIPIHEVNEVKVTSPRTPAIPIPEPPPTPKYIPKELKVAKKGKKRKKMNISMAERKRRSENMKRLLEAKRNVKSQ